MAAKSYCLAAAELQRILGPDSVVIGALAVNAHGYIRATHDVDIAVRMPLAQARKLLESHGIQTDLIKGDPMERGFSCLKGVIGVGPTSAGRTEGILFDILPELVPIQPEKALTVSLHGHSLRIVDLETLVRLKLKAGSAQDFYDIAMLAHRNPAAREAALEHTAHRPRLIERLKRVLDDPHVASKAAHQRRGEKLLAAFARAAVRTRRDPRGR